MRGLPKPAEVQLRHYLQGGHFKHLIRAYRGWRPYNPATGTIHVDKRFSTKTVQRAVSAGTLDVYEFDEEGQVQVYALGAQFLGWKSSS
ncbi:hypothetical protein CcrMagneto_gp313 [Caulobacter virus Magneto]|uniref:hypothetical protein n=1 Tax=Caulobacter virus Magneto TaxID=1211642 RepID=UPI00028A5D00|nr:hypothetical protein CcrMagneto_gp313 [Caulobacter virus Magneto]AFU87483.1 hypothetical protein CcrMagneto_gp313 [Caulobacter virus Magneto]